MENLEIAGHFKAWEISGHNTICLEYLEYLFICEQTNCEQPFKFVKPFY